MLKNSKKILKTSHLKAQGLIILVALILCISPVLVLSADFDNTISKPAKTFDNKDNKDISLLTKYPAIKIDNWFGVGDTLAEAYISEHTESCGISCSSNIQIKLYKDAPLIDDVRFYTLDGNKRTLQNIRSYQFYIKTSEEEINVDDYEWTCTETGKINVNGTAETKCENKKIGTHKEKKPLWEAYSIGTEVPAGTYEVKLEGKKSPKRNVDWQIKTNGVWTTDWATWNVTLLNVGLVHYYKLDETSGMIASDSVGSYNGELMEGATFTTGLINNGIKNGTYGIMNLTQSADIPPADFSLSFWVNSPGTGFFVQSNSSASNFNIQVSPAGKLGLLLDAANYYSPSDGDFSFSGWQNIVLVSNATGTSVYINGTRKINRAGNNMDASKLNFGYNQYSFADIPLDGNMDEIGIWNRTLTDAEITDLYNGGIGIQYTTENQVVILNSPANNSISSSNSVDFNCSATVTGGATLTNMSLWHNGTGTFELNQTETNLALFSGLQSYYPMDNNTDVVNYNNNLSALDGQISFIAGKIGNGGKFSGTETMFIEYSNEQWNMTNPTTINLWLNKTNSGISEAIFTKGATGYMYSGAGDTLTIQAGAGTSTTTLADDTWTMITITRNATHQTMYINGVFEKADTITSWGVAGNNVTLGDGTDITENDWTGMMDELGVWNRALSQTEITQLYNGGSGFAYNGISNGNIIFTTSITNPTLWTCQACDSDGDCGFASENRTVLVDTSAPSINIVRPAILEDIGYASGIQNLSWIITDGNFASAWYNYNGTNISLNGATNSTTFQLDGSDRSLTFWANDTAGNVNSTTRSWNYSLFSNLITYDPSVTATSNETFTINLTYVTADWLGASAVLNYNGTNYISVKTATTNNLIFNNTLIVPNPATATNYSFFWNVSLTNSTGTYYITSTPTMQLVNPLQTINITSLACGAGFSSAFNFTSLIEANLSEINFTTINYNLQYGSSGNSSALVSSGTITNVPAFNICINSSSSYYVGYGEIQYQVSGYSARRFYLFLNTRVTNTTVANNLYSLETASSTPFQITATDTTLSAYVGYYVGLLRWYPDLNTYKVVDMGKTDALGQTVVNVKTNDVDYRLALYSPDGTLIKLLDPVRMVCQTTPCVYSLIVDLSGVDLTTFLNIQSSLTFDTTTKVFTYIFNDPSQDTTSMNMTVWLDKGNADSEIICSTTSSSFTGILVCDVSAYQGQVRAEVYRQASPPILIAQKIVDIRNSLMDVEGGKTMILFIGLILTITMALMGVVSPPLVVILSVIALIPLMFLGLFSVALLVLIGAIGGIILHMMRRVS